ncbi:type II CRISPR-associated endonuclease Cas1 [Sinomicrobium soli]|uniref:type II CRISPR-associated endonuclease Cas1 n=1 Tax=Sinomicrobium sp. N-1-3-6 TaxID=2219864 RepID=UPI000DCE407B|nr:type II CRISPR-associated endonuclease Cas1 [Sinomicrobium sp. N-1-3-6]RAV28181.1 type II CRISPR-associated endonuclease Cas1 [Sinomicrobium sp. N-1-3-6]
MIKRTIYIGNPAYLKFKDRQLKVIDPENKEEKGSVPVEDMAVLMLDNYQVTISHQLIVALQGNNVAVISCDAQHLPFAMMLPMSGHVEHSERLKQQINISEPLRKQLWKQTVEAKISQQMLLLKKLRKPHEPLVDYMSQVRSGDSTNMEGIAAQYYWKQLFENFTREREGDMPNNFLNFGYAVLRSIVARALVSSGLNPTLGIFHRNKYNAYCLADDIMEPYRPYVDLAVYRWMEEHPGEGKLTREVKADLLQLATCDVMIMQKLRPLMVAVSSTTSSLYKCITGELRSIRYPVIY